MMPGKMGSPAASLRRRLARISSLILTVRYGVFFSSPSVFGFCIRPCPKSLYDSLSVNSNRTIRRGFRRAHGWAQTLESTARCETAAGQRPPSGPAVFPRVWASDVPFPRSICPPRAGPSCWKLAFRPTWHGHRGHASAAPASRRRTQARAGRPCHVTGEVSGEHTV
jgi:hypothetical protein